MGIKKAVTLRIANLCKDRKIKLNALANLSGVTPSTVYSMFDDDRADIGIVALKKLCDGFEISVTDFFDDEIFKVLEQEIE